MFKPKKHKFENHELQENKKVIFGEFLTPPSKYF
jgi:hypothetical protein